MRIETVAVHAGRWIDAATGAVAAPIHLSTTFQRGVEGDYPQGFSYAREQNPNRAMLETCLAELEGGKRALAFSTGLAATTALVQGLEPGDHIVAPDDVYYGLRKVIGEVFAKARIEVSYVDMSDLEVVAAAMRSETRLVWIETPSNPLLKITDLAAIAQIARKGNAISLCDGTFATPVLQRPFEYGIDMVLHSTTKYMGGHSDVMGGAIVTNHDNYLFERAHTAQKYGGGVPSPFDCWLILRGISTLPWRVRAQTESARLITEHLVQHPAVEKVHYPGLSSHPGHDVARRQMKDFGAMISIQVVGGREEAMAISTRTKLFIRATSLGGTHSLIEHRASVEGPTSKTPQNLLRLSIGLENSEDLIEDLDHALAARP
jgi:cystathionine gamma-synthase